MLSPYTWLLFDADGTLFDYDRAEARALAATLAQFELQHERNITAVYRTINAQMWRDFERGRISQEELRSARFAALLQTLGLSGDPHAISAAYLGHLGRTTDLIEDAQAVVLALAQHYDIALITNGIPEVQHGRLSLSPLRPYIKQVTISGEVGYAKPDPRIFEDAFAKMGRPPKEHVLLIGDSLSADIQGGNAYGIATCWFNPAGAPPDPAIPATCEVQALRDLLPLLGVT